MGEILAEGLLRAGWETANLMLVARREERALEVERHTAIEASLDPAAAVAGKDVIVIAVKPKDVDYLLHQIGDSVANGQVIISLAAGVPIAVFEQALPNIAVIRAIDSCRATRFD